MSKSMHNWRRYPPWNCYKIEEKHAVVNLNLCCGIIWHRREKLPYGCTTTVPYVRNSPKDIWEYLLPVWLLVCTNSFIPSHFWTKYPCILWQLLLALCCNMQKKISRYTYTFLALKYCSGILLKSFAIYTKLCTKTFSPIFGVFQFSTAIWRK